MSDLSATIRLRPTRIALLVRPSDVSSIRKFMRLCACLWGGAYNPIIPVFRTRPREWRNELSESMTGAQVARGYVEFFEPDVFVEATPGLLRKIGIGALRDTASSYNRVVALDALLAPAPYRKLSEFSLGLGIVDALEHIYEREQRFQLREERSALLVDQHRGSGLAEAVFGLYPDDESSRHFAQAYRDVFRPHVVQATPATWVEVYNGGALTPLAVTDYRLERQGFGGERPKFFVFDPAKPTDLIDLWNLRLVSGLVVPVPIGWWPAVAPQVSARVEAEFQSRHGRPGAMRSTVIEFARSIDEVRREGCVQRLEPTLPPGSIILNAWRIPAWEQRRVPHVVGARRLRVAAKESTLTLTVRDGHPPSAEFAVLAPDFASLYRDGQARWVNVVKLTSFGSNHIATLLPSNVTNAAWPRLDYLSGRVVVGTEGWSFPQRFKDSTQAIGLPVQDEAVIVSLREFGVEARLSDAGHIAKQVLQHLRRLHGLQLVAYPDTLKLLNGMAGGIRVRNRDEDEVEEVFDRRARSEQHWQAHLKRRLQCRPFPVFKLSDLTDRNVIRLGVSTKCPRCTASNWHSLTDVDYVVVCERCLERYSFPQGALQRKNDNWHYRVIGPFSTPDFARGSYGALLALRALDGIGPDSERMTFSTALELDLGDGAPCEVDYAAWVAQGSAADAHPPRLVFGEAKSFGEGNLVKSHDLVQLRRVAKRFPGAVIVISVLRETFNAGEVRILKPFVKWARKANRNLTPRNPVIFLTGVELFQDFSFSETWLDKGGVHGQFAGYHSTRDLDGLARATQAIYLDLPTSDVQ